ncbi:hypothetical protein C2E23DRAFT_107754 [Lenzites betulinus]|nr:hypothetical protein C2E23DRAFT_107754 [Lenzites betulinus]
MNGAVFARTKPRSNDCNLPNPVGACGSAALATSVRVCTSLPPRIPLSRSLGPARLRAQNTEHSPAGTRAPVQSPPTRCPISTPQSRSKHRQSRSARSTSSRFPCNSPRRWGRARPFRPMCTVRTLVYVCVCPREK